MTFALMEGVGINIQERSSLWGSLNSGFLHMFCISSMHVKRV